MSLVVHKLVLSPDGAAPPHTPTRHVTLAAYTHSRPNVGDSVVRSLDGATGGSMSAQPSSSSPYSSSSSSTSTFSPSFKQSSTYNLPFVLQDHNYGAPPPPTPPQSPPPMPSSSAHHETPHHHPHGHSPHQTLHQQQKQHHHPQQNISLTNTNVRHSVVTSAGSPVPISGLLHSHPLSTMPPHRQQFMPHPKTSIFPSPHIPPPPVELVQSPPALPTAPPISNTGVETDDDSRLSDRSSSVGPSGEETETAPEGEGDEQPVDDSITRCVCDFAHDDGYMIQCDRCFVWQHVDCMEIDRDNIPDEYLCEACEPRSIDRLKARALQIRRRQEIKVHLAQLSSSDSDDNLPMCNKSRAPIGKNQERKVVKKKKVRQIKDMKNSRKGQLSLLKKSNIMCTNNNVQGSEERDRRMLVKTRRRKSSSMSGGEGVSDDSSGGPVERLRAWVEGYEVAVTNHYSPELRARVHAARINGVSPDLRASTQGAVLGHRCKVVENPHPIFDVFDTKILVAAARLSVNTAISEFQGKYLLASQWNAQQPLTGQQYLPYVLQYHMPKEGLTVVVDARTYGNEARFARRSCKPNAEIRHVVERGSLHLYLVATKDIEEAEEVTLALETANSTLDLTCCILEEHVCYASHQYKTEPTSPPQSPQKRNGFLNNRKMVKKQHLQLQLRTSKRTTSTESRNSDSVTTAPAPVITPVTPVKQRRASGCAKSPSKSPPVAAPIPVSLPCADEPVKDSVVITSASIATAEPSKTLDKQQQQKMTREERKIAAYMKAFERMEKAAQRRQEMEKKKEEDRGKEKDKDRKHCEGEEEDWEKTSSADEGIRNTPVTERTRQKGKKGRGKGSPQKRSLRFDATASDLTGDESSCASVGLMSPVGGSVEGIALTFSSPPSGNSNVMGFRFPKTKKALMNEWLNENVDPVMPVGSPSGLPELHSGVPTCYMRSPATPLRRSTSVNPVVQGPVLSVEMPGGSAKKRWLRQAISEETEAPQFNGLCPSPNSRPDSPTCGGDYITPLKKRRLARESMSSEQSSTPPSTPVHSTSMEEDKMEEMEAELAAEGNPKDRLDEDFVQEEDASNGQNSTKARNNNSVGAQGFGPEHQEKNMSKKEAEILKTKCVKVDNPLCLSSPKPPKDCDDDSDGIEDEEEDCIGSLRGKHLDVKRKKKLLMTRRKKKQQFQVKRERKLVGLSRDRNHFKETAKESGKINVQSSVIVGPDVEPEKVVGGQEEEVLSKDLSTVHRTCKVKRTTVDSNVSGNELAGTSLGKIEQVKAEHQESKALEQPTSETLQNQKIDVNDSPDQLVIKSEPDEIPEVKNEVKKEENDVKEEKLLPGCMTQNTDVCKNEDKSVESKEEVKLLPIKAETESGSEPISDEVSSSCIMPAGQVKAEQDTDNDTQKEIESTSFFVNGLKPNEKCAIMSKHIKMKEEPKNEEDLSFIKTDLQDCELSQNEVSFSKECPEVVNQAATPNQVMNAAPTSGELTSGERLSISNPVETCLKLPTISDSKLESLHTIPVENLQTSPHHSERIENSPPMPSHPIGPRTPEGPAPTSPEEPDSPHPVECHSNMSPGEQSPKLSLEEMSFTDRTPIRGRGPCTPPSTPPPQLEEAESDRDHNGDSTGSKSQSKLAPVKRKLSILEYRKRKSVSSESDNRGWSGARDQSPPPCQTSGAPTMEPSFSSISSSSHASSFHSADASVHGSPVSMSASPGKATYSNAVDSSPDLSLSPIRPLSLTLPAVFEDKCTKDEGKREGESNTPKGDTTAGEYKETKVSQNTSAAHHTVSANTSQEVKWNAAPTLLERQRENLTARLRREFGLCVSDDDEEKTGLRLNCMSSMVGRVPAAVPSPSSILGSSPVSPRGCKPSGHQPPLEGEDRDKGHRRHKDKNLPPPPPPPTAPPKNSIFQGREVSVQKVACTHKGVISTDANPVMATSNTPGTSTGRLSAHTGLSNRLPVLPHLPGTSNVSTAAAHPSTDPVLPPHGSNSSMANGPHSVNSAKILQVGQGPPNVTAPTTFPVDMSSIVSPKIPASPNSSGQQMAVTSVTGQIGSHSSSQVTGYSTRTYSRGQYSGTGSGIAPCPSGRVAPSPPNSLPPQVSDSQQGAPSNQQQGPQPPPQAPSGMVSPGVNYSGNNYSGVDCSAPGSRGS